ncbi:hypothetical protein ACO1O0_008373 [Amphichorda felina]
MPTPPQQQQQQQQPPQPSPGPPKKRVRSESQLNQKRLADRLGHKERRKEHKQRIGKIEDDISDIKSTLQALTLHLRALAPAPTASLPPPGLTPAPGRQAVSRENSGSLMTRLSGGPSTLAASASASGLGLFAPASWPTVSSSSASTSSPQNQGPGFFPTSSSSPSSTANYASMWSSLPAPPESMKILNCRCGLQHPDSFNCMDSCNITTVYQRHTAFPPNPSLGGGLPRNPSIPAMMLHTMDENLATFFITGFLRNFSHRSLEQLLGFYLIGYRYMRWLMQPTEETLRDVPRWMLPTEMQKTHPHHVCVDYLPWPPLRDYLCVSGEANIQSIGIYLQSLVLLWPSDRPVLGQDETGQVVLSADFETVVSKLENWSLGPPWSDAFPHLMHLIRP